MVVAEAEPAQAMSPEFALVVRLNLVELDPWIFSVRQKQARTHYRPAHDPPSGDVCVDQVGFLIACRGWIELVRNERCHQGLHKDEKLGSDADFFPGRDTALAQLAQQ